MLFLSILVFYRGKRKTSAHKHPWLTSSLRIACTTCCIAFARRLCWIWRETKYTNPICLNNPFFRMCLALCTYLEAGAACFNESGRWVLVLVDFAGPLGVIIGECDKRGSKRYMRAHIGGPSVRTKRRASRIVKQDALTNNPASSNKIQEIFGCPCVQNEGIRFLQAWLFNEGKMYVKR